MGSPPIATVIVPTFARPTLLRRCLDGIARLETATFSFEVVVVAEGPEPLDALVATYADRLDLSLIRNPRAGPASARNAGVAVAWGRYLVFIDDDCTPAASWLGELVRELSCDDRRLLGGRVENALLDNLYSAASEHISQFVYEYNRTGTALEPFFTANIARSRPTCSARSVDSRCPSLARLPKTRNSAIAGAHTDSLWRTSLPRSSITRTTTFTQFLRQHFHYGRGIATFRLTRRRRSGGAFLPEPIKFYLNLLLSPMVRTSSVARADDGAASRGAVCDARRCAAPRLRPANGERLRSTSPPGPRLTPPLGLRPRSR